MADNGFKSTVDSLFNGMAGFLSTKTVVGDPITIGDVILVPLVDVSFGAGAGAFADSKKNNAAGGMGGKMSASAILVITPNGSRLVNVKNQDAVTKVLDMVPELADRFATKDFFKKGKTSETEEETPEA